MGSAVVDRLVSSDGRCLDLWFRAGSAQSDTADDEAFRRGNMMLEALFATSFGAEGIKPIFDGVQGLGS